ncbi:nucleotidyl transferase AbiEii/AbiGii toxin family protein [bacterium]|jgi:predicted nucleotidyltransferase component of viral defense system|nr:nucleotidyl transferase AbiEii/AbiGii toxin family protein [bacterium]MBT3852710.1 nucleotidyl transferase AbiEii/AbiGii toxin family protein [bacterium]
MNIEDIFSNKLVALINRSQLANRDIYDIHFLLKKQILANKAIIIQKTGENLSDYIIKVIDFLQKLPKNYNILN